uniref:Protein-S-isoprenylcysteine O-methyltransferase n=1 Tax=Anthurium amnicola TaxID=1678845 RepID=A0A1D1ZIJ4_9ARAE
MATATLLLACPPLPLSPPHVLGSGTRPAFPLPSPPTLPATCGGGISLRPNSKHLLPFPTRPTCRPLNRAALRSFSHSSAPHETKTLPAPFSSFALPSFLSAGLSQVTPLTVCKWAAVVCFAVAAGKKVVGLLLNPFFWVYFSWTWLFWPWVLAVAVGVFGLCCLRKHAAGDASVFEQLAVVTSAILWLTLVPPAHFNGYLEGWPIAFFFVYHYFFFFESTVRRRLYGDLQPRSHDPKWDVRLPAASRIAFAALVLVGHWVAAWEGPELHLVPGGWVNVGTWALIVVTIFMRYHSILYLAKYSEKVAVPTAVVQFGPYRWVRHPIYASTMLLFSAYCIALRAPFSFLFLLVTCLVYYGQKAQLEEKLMVETFGQRYTEYTSKLQKLCRN